MNNQVNTDLLVIGGGAAGLCAAAEAAGSGANVMIIESDLHVGGQLVKQTHKFFGSKDEYAGTRGFKIADTLLDEINALDKKITIATNTTVTGFFPEDDVYTAMKGEEKYYRIKAKKTIIATGAQERILPFTNNDIPGVYGAGAVQTLMNLYGVVPGDRVLMVGAGNIGLIVSYQLIQAGVDVAAVIEAMPKVGGYWVHAAKIRRLGVPILLRHTILEATGESTVTGAVISEIDDKFQPINGPKKIDCDVICMAVGLIPTTEIFWMAGAEMRYVPQLCGYVPLRDKNMRTSNPNLWVAGDAAGIEEASAAMVEGRIAGFSAAKALGCAVDSAKLDEYWTRLAQLRAGEAGAKIRSGLSQAMVDVWRA